MTDVPNFEGIVGASEHRTVGPRRAYCYDDHCWCYPDDLCDCCHYALGHKRVWVEADGNE